MSMYQFIICCIILVILLWYYFVKSHDYEIKNIYLYNENIKMKNKIKHLQNYKNESCKTLNALNDEAKLINETLINNPNMNSSLFNSLLQQQSQEPPQHQQEQGLQETQRNLSHNLSHNLIDNLFNSFLTGNNGDMPLHQTQLLQQNEQLQQSEPIQVSVNYIPLQNHIHNPYSRFAVRRTPVDTEEHAEHSENTEHTEHAEHVFEELLNSDS